MTMTLSPTRQRPRVHPAWWVAAVAFLALLAAAGFRAAPGALMVPLETDFGWPMSAMSAAVSLNLVLYGLVSPFAAALMDRFGIRQVVSVALGLVALGAAGSVFMTESWQLFLFWGVLIGGGTGSMAMVLAATISHRWFVARRRCPGAASPGCRRGMPCSRTRAATWTSWWRPRRLTSRRLPERP